MQCLQRALDWSGWNPAGELGSRVTRRELGYNESLWLSGLSPNIAGRWKSGFYLELKRKGRSVFIIM